MLFFFFTQKTAYEMRISDWSSDVCSSDLTGMSAPTLEALSGQAGIDDVRRALAGRRALSSPHGATVKLNPDQQKRMIVFDTATIVADSDQTGSGSCRERVSQYV